MKSCFCKALYFLYQQNGMKALWGIVDALKRFDKNSLFRSFGETNKLIKGWMYLSLSDYFYH
jgi:hypothetical protein